MDAREREAVHRLAGAFSRLSLAAELVALAKPGPARAALVDRMEAARKLALAEFAAAQDALAAPEMFSAELSASPPPGPASPPLRAAQVFPEHDPLEVSALYAEAAWRHACRRRRRAA